MKFQIPPSHFERGARTLEHTKTAMTQIPFDRLIEFVNGNADLGDRFSMDDLYDTDAGKRKAQWDTEEIARDWTGKMHALFALEQAGLAGRILFYDEDYDDFNECRTLIIGEDQGERTWAILIEMDGIRTGFSHDFRPHSTEFKAYEHLDDILGLVEEKALRQMSNAADTILTAIKDATGGDPEKMQLLKKSLEQNGGAELLALWQVQEDATYLAGSTPTPTKKRPGKRL